MRLGQALMRTSGYQPVVMLVVVFWLLIVTVWMSDSLISASNNKSVTETEKSPDEVPGAEIPTEIPPEAFPEVSLEDFPEDLPEVLPEVLSEVPTDINSESPIEIVPEFHFDECQSCNMTIPKKKPKSLISYVYNETPSNRRNLEFLIEHGLHKSVDWAFSFNGETNAEELLPNHESSPWYDPQFTNIMVFKRENTCYDFGAHSEVLLREWSADRTMLNPMATTDNGGEKFYKSYSRFILMNASIRGPFMPAWSNLCWSDAFWDRVTEQVKLVGMAYNCHGGQGHVQSMVWATDLIGLSLLLQPAPVGLGYWCPNTMLDAIQGEIRSTPAIMNGGFEVDALTAVYHSRDGDDLNNDGRPDHKPDGYRTGCGESDFFHENAYFGFNVHPYETIFMKTARHMQETLIGKFTEWVDGNKYSSYDLCDDIPS